ncbi:MAG: prepilin-type N-terminal cleavage/methylation domain-containing protein [Candidatus Omnitrophica bacterium]|nr:prepilin-type N-terminal cleavage/methylation domain-containing protein [Candidatus Omnitrophota bacterium]
MSRNKSSTLFELIIALALFSFLVLGVITADFFVRHQVVNAQRRIVVQNDLAFVVEHMSKQLKYAIGSSSAWALQYIVIPAPNNEQRILVYVDANGNAQRDTVLQGDRNIAYRFYPATKNVVFCQNFSANCSDEVLSNHITSLTVLPEPNFTNLSSDPPSPFIIPTATLPTNCIFVLVTGCWDPAQANQACGTADNPAITLQTGISMPSVSVN